jgi:xylulokinase
MAAIGLDVGTSGAKALLVDGTGRVLARASRGYAVTAPEPGAAELDARMVLAAAEAVVAEVAAAAPGTAQAIGISCQGEAVVPVDADGQPLAALQVSSDQRPAAVIAAVLAELPADAIYLRTGHTPAPLFTLFKLRWLAEHHPEIHARARAFHCVEDLIHRHWGLEPAMGLPLAGRTLLFDVRRGTWDAELCALARVRPSQLARPLPSGAAVGRLSAAVAARLGVATGCTVVAGGHDQCCAALGAGAVLPGQAVYGCGTVECITPTFAAPVLSDALRRANLCTYAAAAPGRWASVAYSLTGGNALAWFRQVSGEASYEQLLGELAPAPSPVLALPYLTASGTPWFDGRTAGALTGLRLDTTRGQMLQGLLEGVAYEMRLNLHLLGQAGLAVDSLRATGGGARDFRLCQLKADAIDRPLALLAEPEAGCLGMAAAGWAAVHGADPAATAAAWARTTAVIEPRAAHRQAHAERFAAYRALYGALAGLAAPRAVAGSAQP